MNKCYCLIYLLLNTYIVTAQPNFQLDIIPKNNDSREEQTKQQLLSLLSQHNMSKWMFTKKVMIESDISVIPHSHPVLTLSTRHLKDDELLLATFIHEQLHWYIEGKAGATDSALKELKLLFPQVPVGFPEGANSEESTYVHFLVCYLEYQAMKELLGELKAKQIIGFWATDHYTWIYKTLLEKEWQIGMLMRKYKLAPVQ